MLPSGYDKLKYRHVVVKYWPLSHVEFNLHDGYLPTYLPTYLVRWLTSCIMPGMTIKKNHPDGLKSGMENSQPC
jgi:hypothetical protein